MGELRGPLLTLPVHVGHGLPRPLKQHGLKLLKVLVHRFGRLPVKLLQQQTQDSIYKLAFNAQSTALSVPLL